MTERDKRKDLLDHYGRSRRDFNNLPDSKSTAEQKNKTRKTYLSAIMDLANAVISEPLAGSAGIKESGEEWEFLVARVEASFGVEERPNLTETSSVLIAIFKTPNTAIRTELTKGADGVEAKVVGSENEHQTLQVLGDEVSSYARGDFYTDIL